MRQYLNESVKQFRFLFPSYARTYIYKLNKQSAMWKGKDPELEKVKNREGSRHAGKVRRMTIVSAEKKARGEESERRDERNPRRSLVRLCEIKTRFTGSFYCGYGVPFISLWTRSTVPFNRFNEYIVPQ